MSLRAYFLPANKAVARWQKNDPPLDISLQDRRAMVLANLKNLGRARTEKSFTLLTHPVPQTVCAMRR
jgi:hypothetical protein